MRIVSGGTPPLWQGSLFHRGHTESRRWRRQGRSSRWVGLLVGLLALAVFGLRCLVTMPCYFLLAAASWGTSAGLAAVSFGRGRRTAPVVYGRACWVRFGACCLALLAGVCAELFLSPVLLRLMLERILG